MPKPVAVRSAATGQALRAGRAALADLFGILVGLEESAPVWATPSFRDWLASRGARSWPPRAPGGLCLVDTSDRAGRSLEEVVAARPDAALVLSGMGRPGSTLRRWLRRIRRRRRPRLAPSQVGPLLERAEGMKLVRLGFEDGPDVPTLFEAGSGASRTGTAFLLARREPFAGEWWDCLRERLGIGPEVVRFELRDRGALAIHVSAGGRPLMVRVVPDGPLQQVVLRNHASLVKLRGSLAGRERLLRLVPEPLLAELRGRVAVLAETFRPGVLAWQVASADRWPALRLAALALLEDLRAATSRPLADLGLRPADLLSEDERRAREADFASPRVRRVLLHELARAAEVLAGVDLIGYASHGDFGFGNILVDPVTGEVTGVIDWDTARPVDLPGVDRVNLEIQTRRTTARASFNRAVRHVWEEGLAGEMLEPQHGPTVVRALFGAAVCRYVTRALSYPRIYRAVEGDFARALSWLGRLSPPPPISGRPSRPGA